MSKLNGGYRDAEGFTGVFAPIGLVENASILGLVEAKSFYAAR